MTRGPSVALKQGTLLALSCAAAFAVPQAANAQSSGAQPAGYDGGFGTVLRMDGHPLTFQGRVSIGYALTNTRGATLGPAGDYSTRGNVWTGESNVRFSGSTRLGGSFIQAYGFQVESGLTLDTGASTATAGVLATRNTGVGLKTSVGSIWAGLWDTPFKTALADYDVLTSTQGLGATGGNWGGTPGFYTAAGGTSNGGGSASNAMSFRRRQANSLNYTTPVWAGFKGALAYSPDEELGIGTAPSPSKKPQLWSGRVEYAAGPFAVDFAYEQHDDYLWGGFLGAGSFGVTSTQVAGAGANSKDKGYTVGGAYTFGDTELLAEWDRLDYTQSGGAAVLTDLKVSKWLIGVHQHISGPHYIHAKYGQVGSYTCSATVAFTCSDTGASMFGLDYEYKFDKNASLNVFWGRFNNDRNGQWAMAASGAQAGVSGTTAGATTGNSQNSYSIGLVEAF